MDKLLIPKGLGKAALTQFLIENKDQLIREKKSAVKFCDSISVRPEVFVNNEDLIKVKSDGSSSSSDRVKVTIVANAMNFMDSHEDVLLDNCAKKSIKERGMMVPHLKDHEFKTTSEIGDVERVYLKNISLKKLGLEYEGKTQCIMADSIVRRDYDEKTFKRYVEGRATQHSIGMRYVGLDLAINDKEQEDYYSNWEKYINFVINKDEAERGGFFWAVTEIKLIEISCVLLGANPLTPTLSVSKNDKSTDNQPLQENTDNQPHRSGLLGVKRSGAQDRRVVSFCNISKN